MISIDHIGIAIETLGEIIKKGNEKFIIYPFGEQGRLAKCILNNYYGIQEEMVVDQNIMWGV